MKLNKEKMIMLIMDAIQVFHDNKDYYNQNEHLTALENSLSEDGKSTFMLMSFINSNITASSWYREARNCVSYLNLNNDTDWDLKKLKNALCIVDLVAGFCIYNLLKGANLENEISFCLEN